MKGYDPSHVISFITPSADLQHRMLENSPGPSHGSHKDEMRLDVRQALSDVWHIIDAQQMLVPILLLFWVFSKTQVSGYGWQRNRIFLKLGSSAEPVQLPIYGFIDGNIIPGSCSATLPASSPPTHSQKSPWVRLQSFSKDRNLVMLTFIPGSVPDTYHVLKLGLWNQPEAVDMQFPQLTKKGSSLSSQTLQLGWVSPRTEFNSWNIFFSIEV